MEPKKMRERVKDWYHQYSNDIYNFAFFMTGQHDNAKDIVQETFLRAYTEGHTFKGGNVKSWLFRIAHNFTIDCLRKQRPVAFYLDPILPIKSIEPTPEQLLLLNEQEKYLFKALLNIRNNYRDVIILRKIKEFSIRETSEILGWSESKVKVTLFRGLKTLRSELKKEGFNSEVT
ncbi:RNA polymerase sigma factor [Radiobacillus kanasensis]|uniref:RNA polymerase sigma factor n=1 Tax=Radiobacillus kanasensis TaxID=2844358 RepID=UPI001E292967|nr:RNA polymerase sigma factor [Radiobacillus kanasensis]UFU00675.1 RNA polymerase sigma factor [Radiobacillus kanasensis]